jgi:hypothetical protein
MAPGGPWHGARRSPRRSGAALTIGVVAGLVIGYLLLGPVPTHGPIPTLWSASGGSNPWGVAANRNDVFRLIVDNETDVGNTNYTILANNLTTGATAWPSIGVFVREDFGIYQSTFGEVAPFFANNNTLSLVVYGTGERVSGQAAAINLSGFQILVLEWNAATGVFLGEQNYSNGEPFGFTYVTAIQSDGWLVVDEISSYPATSIWIQTFPELTPGSQFERWNVNVSIPAYNWSSWPLLAMTAGDGLLTFTVLQGNGTTILLSESSGAVVWKGLTPTLYSGEGRQGTVGYYDDIARSGDGLYFLGQNGSVLSLDRFDLSTHSFATIVGALPVTSSRFPSIELESELNGNLIVTDAWDGIYYGFSSIGELLWTDHVELTATTVPSDGGLSALAFEPIEFPDGMVFTALFEDQSWVSGPTGGSYNFVFSMPLQLLNGTTGGVVWQSSYSASFTMGNPGPTTIPTLYLPLVAEGSDLVFLHGSDIGVADLPD